MKRKRYWKRSYPKNRRKRPSLGEKGPRGCPTIHDLEAGRCSTRHRFHDSSDTAGAKNLTELDQAWKREVEGGALEKVDKKRLAYVYAAVRDTLTKGEE